MAHYFASPRAVWLHNPLIQHSQPVAVFPLPFLEECLHPKVQLHCCHQYLLEFSRRQCSCLLFLSKHLDLTEPPEQWTVLLQLGDLYRYLKEHELVSNSLILLGRFVKTCQQLLHTETSIQLNVPLHFPCQKIILHFRHVLYLFPLHPKNFPFY